MKTIVLESWIPILFLVLLANDRLHPNEPLIDAGNAAFYVEARK
ncbi:MAG TPA: hypothetical protein VNU49_06765 [Opitutaceae bacterium]|jgi:hypothetical protein|nr:hypothetical protein [Opitutaceae bacterium]